MTFSPPPGQDPYRPHNQYGQPGPHTPLAGAYPSPAAYPTAPNHGYPMGTAGFEPPTPKQSKAGLIALIVLLVLGLGVGGFFGVRALTGDDSDSSGAAAGSGEIFTPPGKPYSVEIPKGMAKVPPRRDGSIPSQTDLSLELDGNTTGGGLIKTGTVSGSIASGTYDSLGAEVERRYAGQYEGHPEKWGKGAKVERKTKKVGGRNAVEISARFSPTGKAEPSIFFRVYFIEPPSGPTILITCDWNSNGTQDIEPACDTLVASFQAKS